MARPREFEPREALDRAVSLFWEKGFDASVDDLVRSTGASRHSLYGVFGTKRELYLQALDRYWSNRQLDVFLPLKRRGASLKAVMQVFDNLRALVRRRDAHVGCLVCNAGLDVGPSDEEVQAKVHQIFGEMKALFGDALREAVAKGELDPDTDADESATYLTAVWQIAAFMHRSRYDGQAIVNVIDIALERLR